MSFWKSIRLSRPKVQVLHGVEIRKLPIGRYLDVMATLGDTTTELLNVVFPGLTLSQVITKLTVVTQEETRELLLRVWTALPDRLLGILASILGTTLTHMREEMTPAELMEVWKAFWALNDLTDFFTNVRNAIPKAMRTQAPTMAANGYSELSPAGSPLGSAAAN